MRICFFGDSYTNGYGDEDCLGWTGRACASARRRGVDLTHYSLGVRGDTSAAVAARWEPEARRRLQETSAGGLVFCFGVNDVIPDAAGSPSVPEDDALANTHAILARASVWLPTLMIGPPPTAEPVLNRRIERLSEGFAELCTRLAVPYLAVFAGLLSDRAWIREVASNDGAHPGAGGNAAWAGLVTAWPAWQAWVQTGAR